MIIINENYYEVPSIIIKQSLQYVQTWILDLNELHFLIATENPKTTKRIETYKSITGTSMN